MRQVVKSLYVEIKREEYDALRATIEQQAARIVMLEDKYQRDVYGLTMKATPSAASRPEVMRTITHGE